MPFKVKSRTIGEDNMPWSAITYPVIASIKYDGRNTIVHKVDKTIIYESSGGKLFKLVNNEPFNTLPNGVYFTEMLGEGIEGKLGDRIHSGIQTSCISNTSKGLPNYQKPNWKIFSYLTVEEYKLGKSVKNYHKILSYISDIAIEQCPRFITCNTEQGLRDYYDLVISEGWEGLMVSSQNQMWDNSTSRLKTLCKLKGRYSMKGTCVGTVDGEGKYTNMVGSLLVQLPNKVIVSPGSGGGSDAWRLVDKNYYIGKIIEFEYEQLSKDGVPLQPTLPRDFIREVL